LGDLEPLGFLNQLLGGLRGARLQPTGGHRLVEVRRGPGVSTPECNRGNRRQNDNERRSRKRNRLRAGPGWAGARVFAREVNHRIASLKRRWTSWNATPRRRSESRRIGRFTPAQN